MWQHIHSCELKWVFTILSISLLRTSQSPNLRLLTVYMSDTSSNLLTLPSYTHQQFTNSISPPIKPRGI